MNHLLLGVPIPLTEGPVAVDARRWRSGWMDRSMDQYRSKSIPFDLISSNTEEFAIEMLQFSSSEKMMEVFW